MRFQLVIGLCLFFWLETCIASHKHQDIVANNAAPRTVISFVRSLDTCDAQDFVISNGTTRVIWAYSQQTPENENAIPYHSKRGSSSIHLAGVPKSKPKIPSDVQVLDIRVSPVTIADGRDRGFSDSRTTYWCEAFQLPNITAKHHIVKAAPVFTAENTAKVHHILLYECDSDFPASSVGKTAPCHSPNMPEGFGACNGNAPIVAWAIGGSDFYWPEEAGYPIGVSTTAKYMVMEIHYDNFDGVPFTDNSGVRLWHTPTLRPDDAGMLQVGYIVHDTMIIPPGQQAYTIKAQCPSECTNRMLNQSSLPALNIFSSVLHMHLAGRSISLEVIRDGKQVQAFSDPYYDFNYQESIRQEAPYPQILPGDSLLTKCTYNTMDRANNTVGGLSSMYEMCLVYMGYYPALKRGDASCHTFGVNKKGHLIPATDPKATAMSWCAGKAFGANLNPPYEIPSKPACVPRSISAEDLVVHSTERLDAPMYENSKFLDSDQKYLLRWSTDEKSNTIRFSMEAEATGWIGLGFSPNGGMEGADMMVGWVDKDGNGHLSDRYSTSKTMPKMDAIQNYWGATAAIVGKRYESPSKTVVTFKRALNTCDAQDFVISRGTTRLIWAYSSTTLAEGKEPGYHSKRGSMSLQLVGTPKVNPLPSNAKSMDVRVSQVEIGSGIDLGFDDERTTYWCEAIKLPSFSEKQHMLRAEPVINARNVGKVHHILVYECEVDIPDSLIGHSAACHTEAMPDEMQRCNGQTPIYGWAIGGGPFYWPDEAGYPIPSGKAKTVVIEIHYDNYDGIPFVDDSGVRFWHSPTLRKYDAGMLQVGYAVVDTMVIPPGESSYDIDARCPSNCTRNMISSSNATALNVFSSMLHSHLAGRAISLKVIRNGEEAYSFSDPYYDFNYQETMHLEAPYPQILPGDSLLTKCTYNTMDRVNDTIGGLSSMYEMCLVYMGYYPALPKGKASCHTFHVGADGHLATADAGFGLSWCAGKAFPAEIGTPYSEKEVEPCVPTPRDEDDPAIVKVISSFDPRDYNHSKYLDADEKYLLHWSTDEVKEEIRFAMEVETDGWVGLGFSENGGMEGSDIVIGWVDQDGKGHLTDRFATEMATPLVDSVQNLEAMAVGRIFTASVVSPEGDDSYPNSIDLDPSLKLLWRRDPSNSNWMNFKAQLSKDAWFGIGFSDNGEMFPSSAVIAKPGFAVQQYRILNSNEASILTATNPNIISPSLSSVGGISTLLFTIDTENAPSYYQPNDDTNVIFAYGASAEFEEHIRQGSAIINFSTGEYSQDDTLSAKLLALHAMLMIFAIGLFLPAGVMIRFIPHMDLGHSIHIMLQTLGTVTVLGSAVAVVVAVIKSSADHLDGLHQILGLFIVLMVCSNAVGGYLRPHLPHEGEQKTKFRKIFEFVHKGLGRVIVVLGAINIYLGFKLDMTPRIQVAVMYVVEAVIVIFVVSYAYLSYRKQSETKALEFEEQEDL